MNRYIIISCKELDSVNIGSVKTLLLLGYNHMKHEFPRNESDNLVMVWQSDFDKLKGNKDA